MKVETLGYEYAGSHFAANEENFLRDYIREEYEEERERLGRKPSVRSYIAVIAYHYSGGDYVPFRNNGNIGDWRKVRNGQSFTRFSKTRVFVL